MKKLLIIAIAAFAFTACNNSAKTEGTTEDSAAAAAPVEAPATPEVAPAPADSAAAATTEAAAPVTTEAAAH